jgi:hypothetical protein
MMDKYEHKVVAAVIAKLDGDQALGMEGWKLIAVDDGNMFFERPFVPPTAAEVKAAEAEKGEEPVGVTTEIVDPPAAVPDPDPAPPPAPVAPVG